MNPWKKLRCVLGLHNPPHSKAFTCMGAVFIGGPCTCCDDETVRQRSFIGNSWDFPGVNESTEPNHFVISAPKLVTALEQRGLAYIGDFPA